MRFTKITPMMFFANDTDTLSLPIKRSQVQPVTVATSPNIRVKILCGSTPSSGVFTTVDEIYSLTWERLARLQGPSWCRNTFRVEVLFRQRLLVNRNVNLSDYGIRAGDLIHINVTGCLLGGSPGMYVGGEYYPDVENTWCARKKARSRKLNTFTCTAHKYELDNRERKVIKRKEKSLMEKASSNFEDARLEIQASSDYLAMAQGFVGTLDKALETSFVKLMEDILVFMMLLMRSRAKADIMLAILVFAKFRTNGAIVAEAMEGLTTVVDSLFDVKEPQIQGLEEQVSSFRDMLSKWDECKDTLMGKKYLRLIKYLSAYGVFACVGVKATEQNLRKAADTNPLEHADFVHCVLDTLSFTLQRSLLFMKTGNWSVFLHGPKTYAAWFDKCLEVKRKAYNLSNLEALGTDYFAFVALVKECIEEGHAIVKFASKDLKTELKAAKFMLHEIMMIEAMVLTKKAAQEERRAPFAVLIHGESSVAKSMFQKMLFYYYGKLMNLPTGSEYRFVRNPADPYWSGFSSQAWCIGLDDVGFLNPAKASEDLSLMELIAIVNNVPLVPNQADLADKGKTPVRARLVLASTNTKDVNASVYFSCPLAVQRRLPWVITVTPRDQFERADAAGMIDPHKMSAIDGDWPDFWRIQVDKVIPGGKVGNRTMAKFETVKIFSDTQSFLDWFGPVCKTFDAIQGKAMVDDVAMQNFELCHVCNRVTTKCSCVQAGNEYKLPEGVTYGEDFVWTFNEGNTQEVREFTYTYGKYMCKVSIYKDGNLLRQFDTPGKVVGEQSEVQSVSTADYADILNEVLERQRKVTDTRSSRIVLWSMSKVLSCYTNYEIFRRFADWTISFSLVRFAVRRMVMNYVPPAALARNFFRFIGVFVERTMTPSRWRKVILGLGVSVAAWVTYRKVCNWNVQGSMMSVPDSHFEKNAKENIWKRDDYQTTAFDTHPLSGNYASLPAGQIAAKIRRNCARIVVRCTGQQIPGNAFCIGGHLWATNNHILPETDGEDLDVEFNVDPASQGTSRNTKFKLQQSQIYRERGSDLAYFEIFAVDVRSDLSALISTGTLDGHFTAKYIGLNRDCSSKDVDVKAVTKGMDFCPAMERTFTYWRGTVAENTVNGDCGSVLVGMKPTVAILGMHQLGGSNNLVYAVKFTQSSLNRARQFFARPLIQASFPRINGLTTSKELGPLWHKSPLRWLTTGSITVFGSFLGYVVKKRSKVSSTLCGDFIKNARSWHIPFGKPNLSDWRPWHLAFKDIVHQENIAERSIIKQAIDGYVRDVCLGLKDSDLKNLRIISDHAAINGIARVQYLDKMNFNSSMGEPYNKCKKWFLQPDPTEEQPEAKKFDEELSERAMYIESQYRKGIRNCPVFSGQLKDEARDEAKILAGKVRMFTGSPGDWAKVVRKYLLSFVKVVQENKMLFEAAPGCVTQSLEWETYREYLTQFGEDQIVAGDYGKFDKKMTAEFILGAFDAIIAILRFAGWNDEDLLVVYGIAEDTAYSFVNVNGTLVMFYGSNPSGHPLTVIINSIVNALYIRYCYIKLGPKRECESFKENVSLLTYGDDNVMGVSKSIPWFNHTAMVGILASIGVEYTMADKESESVPYINIKDVSFLKRTWRFDEDVGAYLCPLDEMSIRKMLCVNIPSTTISPEAQMVFVMRGAMDEWFFYGKEKFEIEREFLLTVIKEFSLEATYALKPFPQWEDLKERFWKASNGIATERLGGSYSHPE